MNAEQRQASFDRAQRAYDAMTPGDEDDDLYEEQLEEYVEANSTCPYCKKKETQHLSGRTFECHDCGDLYEGKNGEPPQTKAELAEERAEYLADQRRDA